MMETKGIHRIQNTWPLETIEPKCSRSSDMHGSWPKHPDHDAVKVIIGRKYQGIATVEIQIAETNSRLAIVQIDNGTPFRPLCQGKYMQSPNVKRHQREEIPNRLNMTAIVNIVEETVEDPTLDHYLQQDCLRVLSVKQRLQPPSPLNLHKFE